jgi:hypothetical protein
LSCCTVHPFARFVFRAVIVRPRVWLWLRLELAASLLKEEIMFMKPFAIGSINHWLPNFDFWRISIFRLLVLESIRISLIN